MAPAFVAQPRNHAAMPGQDVRFSAEADGIPAPSFQWQKDGFDIEGATEKDVLIAGVDSADVANCRCVARNSADHTTSKVAVLQIGAAVRFKFSFMQSGAGTVTFDPQGTMGDDGTNTFLDGANTAVSAEAAPGWRLKSMTYASGAEAVLPSTRSLRCCFANRWSGVSIRLSARPTIFRRSSWWWTGERFLASSSYLCSPPPSITAQPRNQTVAAGDNVNFGIVADGSPARRFMWQMRGDGGGSWTDLADSGRYSGVATAQLSITGTEPAMNSSGIGE